MVKAMQPEQLLTRREAAAILGCSMRTVSRRIKDGTLETRYRSSGVPGIVPASVMALQEADTATEAEAHDYASSVAPPDLQLAARYAALWQASKAVTEAGLLGRRAAMQQLRAALEAMPDPTQGLTMVEASTVPQLEAAPDAPNGV